MASRVKERGGGSVKVMAPKPQKIQTETITPRLQPITRKTLTATATATKERVTASGLRSQAEIPSVRWSTSSLPRGKSSSNLDLSLKDKLGKASNLKSSLSRRSSMDVKDKKILGRFMSSEDLATKSVSNKQKNKENSLANYKSSSEKLKVKENVSASSKVAVVKSSSNSSINNETRNVHVAKVRGREVKMGKRHGEDETSSGNCPVTAELVSKSELELLGTKERRDAVSTKVDAQPSTSVVVCNEIKEKESKLEVKKEEKNPGNLKVFEDNSENSDQAAKKYPTKLHEKLAALEGRVQRIASDIKKTKDLLALNEDQSHSKLILSDIQKKISGIENAVSFVIEEDGAAFGLSDLAKDSNLSVSNGHAQNANCSSKGLNLDELEARFYPHQKFMKDRSSRIHSSKGSRSPTDENPNALEFLSSLNAASARAKEMVMEKGSSGVNVGSRVASSLQNKEDTSSLLASEKLEDFDDQENKQTVPIFEDTEDSMVNQIYEIGRKPSTGGWFVSEGEAVLLTHNDGTCSYYDIANYEEKAEYKPPDIASSNLWGDCWLIRAPGSDGCSSKYVVAASAGSTLESGFCSWDFYTKSIKAFKFEPETSSSSSIPTSRVALAPLSNLASSFRRNTSCTMPSITSQQWWYRPCGPLLIYTASGQKNVSAYDIRDGEQLMKWNTNSFVAGMDYSSPLQWRSRGKIVLAESEAVCVWDVNSLTPQPLLSVSLSGKKISCLHVNNTDAEVGGGVRQRARSSEVEGNDGVFCTQDSINVLDFRLSSGVGLKISKQSSSNAHSVFSSGDSIFIGSTETRLPLRSGPCPRVLHISVRSGKQVSTYPFPDSNSHLHHSSITQVWGNSNFVMGISGMGLSIFCSDNDAANARETVGPDDLYCPTFDYLGSRVLVISRDRPAMWRYLL